MRYFVLGLILVFLSSCNSKETETELTYNLDSANLAIDITNKIENNETITEIEWQAMFDSQGYQGYFCAFESSESIPLLKRAFSVVFDKTNTKILDSILNTPIKLDPNARFNYLVLNLNSFKENQEQVKSFVANTDFSGILNKAKTLAQKFIPKEDRDAEVDLYDISFNLMEPNAYVTNCGIIVDIQHAFKMGESELIKTIAHEFHHNYRNLNFSGSDDVIMANLNDLQQEGIADLIDKPIPPIKEMGVYPQSMVDAYNQMYVDTPQILKRLDSLTTGFLSKEIDENTYRHQTTRYFMDGGHANGLYMTLKIKDAGLLEDLVATYNDPIAFVNLYNKAVANSNTDHQFTESFMTYIEEIQKNHETYLKNTSDQQFEVTFIVNSSETKEDIFITGSQEALGNWLPDQVKLSQGDSEGQRKITLNLNSPIEFKFTRGSWKTEGIVEGQRNAANRKLMFDRDTVVTYDIIKWMDRN